MIRYFLAFLQNFNVVLISVGLLFCFTLPKRKHFWILSLTVPVFMFVFCREASFFMPWREYGLFSKILFFNVGDVLNLGFIIIFACMVAILTLCFDAPFSTVLSLSAMAYATQNLTFHINYFFRNLLFGGSNASLEYRLLSEVVIVAVVFLIYFFFVRHDVIYFDLKPNYLFSVSFCVIVLIITSSFSYWIYYFELYNPMLSVFAVAVDSLLCIIFYTFSLKEKAEEESKKVELLLQKGRWQQEYIQSNIDLINRKCHDLKNEISVLKSMGDARERENYISELEKSIMIYDSHAITGNESLDILLTEKRLKCNSEGIVFSCIADGKLLNFLRPSEISVFFGNALDNAIEAECKGDAEKRRIVLNVAKKNDMITISIENYFSGDLVKGDRGGLLKTKDDKREHGYGMKSMRLIVEKYNGSMQYFIKKERFCLKAIFNRSK